MGDSYTIRCCRQATSHANAPHGPYVDKGRDVLRVQHEAEPAPCQVSMLLGPDGDHLVPGHRHIWQEADGALYDYRDQIPSVQEHSMAVRRLHFDGWPTVWIHGHRDQPGARRPDADARAVGAGGSRAAFDNVRVSYTPTTNTTTAAPTTTAFRCPARAIRRRGRRGL